ncbi:hypothetical protein [Alkalilacustris brevis]|uniref:hypothetical protein n=1 Tax=Alkalilacustris brevis TaxID=2026338 RepID=UPI000E0DE1FE|nr:hypothetical protein [Alkalilacustris brevis]
MDMIFDTATGQLSIDTSAVHPWGADLRAMLDRHGQIINLRGVEMRLTITADGAQVFDMALPPPGVRFSKTDQDVIATGRVRWQPDQQIEVASWCRTSGGAEMTAEASFTAPRPVQPYPSWEWDGSAWAAPVPRPEGDGWQWDEDAGAWVESDFT